MITRLKISVLLAFLFFSVSLFSQSHQVRIGFIGNSITIGSGLTNPTVECYPSQLSLLLKEKYGDTCLITNYAVSGRTLLKKGDFPWWNEPDFTRCRNYSPDIVVIALGTNDSKPYNWDVYGDEFFSDYQALIDTFKTRNPEVKFIVCLPPPAFAVVWEIRNPVIIDEIIPKVDSIAKMNDADVVDFYHPLLDSVHLFPDKIHPNAKGAKVLAKIVYDEMVGSGIIHEIRTGRPVVTALSSSVTGELRILDKATISWKTLNTEDVFLNGTKVTANGSLVVSPSETTSYTLVAKGETSADSLTLMQKVYVPRLAKITISTAIRTINTGDSVKLKLNYYDQTNKVISDSAFVVNWSVTQGSGHFVNQAGNLVQFVGDGPGTAILLCTCGAVSNTISMTVKGFPVGVQAGEENKDMSIWPNPFTDQVFVHLPVEKPGMLSIKVTGTDGRWWVSETRQLKESGMQEVEVNTAGLPAGMYLLKLETGGKGYAATVIKEMKK